MYNLLKIYSQSQEKWEQNQGQLLDISFLIGRIFEHTEDAIKQEFTGDSGPDFDALKKLPCLFTYEGREVTGSIGRISDIRSDRRKFEISYSLPTIYPNIRLDDDRLFESLGMGPSGAFEKHRTHWAVKDVDLFEVTTRLLYEANDVPVVLSNEEMSRVWGDGFEGRTLIF